MKFHGLKSGEYKTILASGKNATVLHYLDNNSLIEENDLILMDIDVERDSYHCDFTRVFPANGSFSPRQKEVYTAVLNVQKQLIKDLKPGITFSYFNDLAKQYLTEACHKLNLLKGNRKLEDYYFHNVGHLIGLDTHDVGCQDSNAIIKEGMVITVEPGIYITEENMGIRIEDMIAVKRNGNINLTECMIKEIPEIEDLMSEY